MRNDQGLTRDQAVDAMAAAVLRLLGCDARGGASGGGGP
jgi:hypothetical protein